MIQVISLIIKYAPNSLLIRVIERQDQNLMQELLNFIQDNQYRPEVFIEIFGIYLAVVWLAVTVWVARDISGRSKNLLVVIIAPLFVAVANIAGLLLYLLVRPESTLEEGQSRDLFYASVLDREISSCDHCGVLVRSDYKFCPTCGEDVDYKCPDCNDKVNPTWKYCANCNYQLVLDPWYVRFATFMRNLLTNKKFRHQQGKKLATGVNKLRSLPHPLRRISLPSLPKLPKIEVELPFRIGRFGAGSDSGKKLKVMSEKRELPLAKEQVKVGKVPATKSSTATKSTKSGGKSSSKSSGKSKSTKKKRRGRPRGKSDNKPRKKRSDAGKKRGSYKK